MALSNGSANGSSQPQALTLASSPGVRVVPEVHYSLDQFVEVPAVRQLGASCLIDDEGNVIGTQSNPVYVVGFGGGTGGITQVLHDSTLSGDGNTIPLSVAPPALAAIGGAPLNSPALTGIPTAPTPNQSDSSNQIATTAFIRGLGYVTGGPYLPITGGTLTGPLYLAENPLSSMEAATKIYVDTEFSSIVSFPEAPADGVVYGRRGSDTSWQPVSVAGSTVAWDNITGKPLTYPPTLPIPQSGITNLVADLASKAPLASPTFTGDPQAPTPPPGDSDTSIATTAFVSTSITAAITSAPNKTITLSGDISGSGTAAIITTLPNINPNSGTFQGLTINAKGQVTAASNQSYLTGNQTITATGDATGSGTTTLPLTLATVNPNIGTFQGLTVNAKGQVTAASNQSYLTGNQTITLSGDLSGSGTTSITATLVANSVRTTDIADANVTYAKIQNVAAGRLLGNPTGLPASPSEISLGTNLSFSGTVLNATAASGLSGMTAGQIPIAASTTTITSSGNLTGDVTTSTGSLATTLATVNANTGTFQGLTLDAKGRVTAAVNQNYLTSNQTITLSGDIAGSGTAAITTTLPNVNLNVGTFQGLTVNAKGQVTAASNQSYLTGNQTITLSGDATGSGTTTLPVTLANTAVTAGSYTNSNITVDSKGRITAAANGSAGTGSGLSGMTAGQIPIAATATTITSSGNLSGDVTSTGLVTVLPNVNQNVGTFNNITINAKGLATAGSNVAYLTANQTITISGDATGSGTTAIPLTLATVNTNVGTFQGITVNAKGLVTAAVNQNYLTGNQNITLTGDIAGSGTTTIATTLPNINANVGTFQGLTLNAKGQVTAAVNQNYAPLASPAFTGTPTAPTPATADNSTTLATTAFVKVQAYAPLASPTFTGTPAAPTATAGTSTTQLATTQFVATSFAPLASPTFTGVPAGPTAAPGTSTTQLATTAFATAAATAAPNQTITLTGDVTGSGTASFPTTVTGLQSRPLASTLPTANQVLLWSGTTWAPGTISGTVTVPVAVGQGGTAATSLPNLVPGGGQNPTSALILTAAGAATGPLHSGPNLGTWGDASLAMIYWGSYGPYIDAFAARGTSAAPTASLAGDNLFQLASRGRISATNWASTGNAAINVTALDAFSATAQGTQISFLTTTPATASMVSTATIDRRNGMGLNLSAGNQLGGLEGSANWFIPANIWSRGLQIQADSGITGYIIVTSPASGQSVFLGRNYNGTIAAPTATLSGNRLALFGGTGHDGTNWTAGNWGVSYMTSVAAENWSSTAHGANLAFTTCAVGSTTPAITMTLDGSGLLTINSQAGNRNILQLNAGVAGNGGYLHFGDINGLLVGAIGVGGGGTGLYLTDGGVNRGLWLDTSTNLNHALDGKLNVGVALTCGGAYLPTNAQGGTVSGSMFVPSSSSAITGNAYLGPGGWTYIAAGAAVVLNTNGTAGTYSFYTAPSGAAGAVISWTQQLGISNNGTLTTTYGITCGDDLMLGRASNPSYILRPNVAGQKGLAFACAGATPLDTCSIIANQTWINGPVIVTAPGGGTPPGQFRMTTGGGIGSMWYNDGGTTFLLLTNSGDWNGNYNSLRPFYANNATGDVTMAHNVTVGGALTASNYLNSVNGTYVSPASGAQWRMYSDGNSLIWTEAGTLRFWFDHNANTFNVGGTGNLNVGGNLSVAGSISSSVAYNCVGANAAYTLDDRTTTGTSANWVMYANSGYLRFFRGGDKATIDTSGTYRGSGTYTAMSAPDSTSYIYIGGTADPQTYYRNGTHTFQNVAASLTWLTINSSVISCYENIAPNADNARYCGFGGNAWLACNSYAYAQSSDAALKTDIEPVRDGCLDLVRAIEPKTYRFINAPVPDVRTRWGFLANDIEDVMLAAEIEFGGYQEQNGVRALEYNQLTAVLWKAVQELSAEVTALKARIPDV